MSKNEKKQSQNSTNSEPQQKSGILFTAEEGHSLASNTETVKKRPIADTPFEMVRVQKENQVMRFIGLGKFRITNDIEDKDEMTEEQWTKHMIGILETDKWNIVLKLLAILIPGEVTAQIAYRDEAFEKFRDKQITEIAKERQNDRKKFEENK